MRTVFKNGTVLNGRFEFEATDVSFQDARITALGSALPGDHYIDVSGCYVLPGLVDTHFHGGMGTNFIDFRPDSFQTIARFQAAHGTTSIAPALSAAKTEKMQNAIRYLAKCAHEKHSGARLAGIHLEGPCFSTAYKGAHLPENIRLPNVEELKRFTEAGAGLLKIITLAPELEGADAYIRYAAGHGITVSLGHSNATYSEAQHAFGIGASQATHLFNAMRPLHHREPGLAGAALLNPNVQCELICDFVHVCPEMIRLAFSLKGAAHITLITDAEIGAGLPDGTYTVNGRTLHVKAGKTTTEDGALAGGSTCLIDGVRNLVSIGIPLEQAVMCATINPARAVGAQDRIGSIAPKKAADFVILNKTLELQQVYIDGRRFI